MGRTLLGLGLVAGVAACNPYGADAFRCETDEQCGLAEDGRCEVIGLCSFPEPACDGGRAYGPYSGTRSGTCLEDDTLPIIDAAPQPDARAQCSPGERWCAGNSIDTCKANGQGYDPALRVACALACDESGGAPQCLAASNIPVADQLACGSGADTPLELDAPAGAMVEIGASSITCTGCNLGVTTIPNRGTTPNVWYCLKTLKLASGAQIRSNNVGPVTLFVAGETRIDADIAFGGRNANGVNGGSGGGPGAHGGASNAIPNVAGSRGGGPCAGGGGQRVSNVDPTLNTAGGGGGAGAAGDGGDGGDGKGPIQTVGAGGSGGNSSSQCDSPSLAQLFGGSGGGSGGGGDCVAAALPAACGGGGGGGGGAIHIATRADLVMAGDIDVSGGDGGNGNSGDAQATGGGGGAGGTILLEARSVQRTGLLDTRGGAGGRQGGAGAQNGLDGQDGRNGTNEGDGGRGGGGAAGRIRINALSGADCARAEPSTACAVGPLRPQ